MKEENVLYLTSYKYHNACTVYLFCLFIRVRPDIRRIYNPFSIYFHQIDAIKCVRL